MTIRNETPADYRTVEELIKKTFWNLYVPGCSEHHFAHLVRQSEDFIPELDFVLEEDGKIIGHIIYVKAKFVATDGTEKEVLSFGPFTIDPDYQRKGYGRKLLDHSLEAASKMGYDGTGFDEFDKTFPQMEKGYKYSQELFYIYCRSNVVRD